MNKKTIVIGAGPAGLMAAATAASLGNEVLVAEKNPQLQKTLSAKKPQPKKKAPAKRPAQVKKTQPKPTNKNTRK